LKRRRREPRNQILKATTKQDTHLGAECTRRGKKEDIKLSLVLKQITKTRRTPPRSWFVSKTALSIDIQQWINCQTDEKRIRDLPPSEPRHANADNGMQRAGVETPSQKGNKGLN
jgi:hypothetical protein